MKIICTKSLYLLLLSLIISLLSGCYAVTSLKKDQPNSDRLISNQRTLTTACLVSITAKVDGAGQNVAPVFSQRVIGKLQESKIFSNVESVVNGGKRPQEPFYELSLIVNETPHPRRFINGVTGAIVGASFFLLTPVLPCTAEYESEMILKVIAPNLREKEYRAYQDGSLTCTLFNCNEGMTKLVGEVTEYNLTYLMNQMAQDEWLSANRTDVNMPKVDYSQYSQNLVKGKTAKQDVERDLGKPTEQSYSGEYEYCAYYYRKSSPNSDSLVPYRLTLKYDNKGILCDYVNVVVN